MNYACDSQTSPDHVGNICVTRECFKRIWKKKEKKKCRAKANPEPSFKYFVNLELIAKLFSIAWKVQTTFLNNLQVWKG